ncbi:hypothetical protein [Streptomyces sp. M92]|uniref:hypothetical protein n=1 Tax=Streptomyces sp. M92 TaxID=2944250 RepID=UPI002348F90D|nr:hypothetical protein [Streptomyces sp. M92]WCN05184.1 hypothetical protein M6G08_25465 [Streptomyces sp. M92]
MATEPHALPPRAQAVFAGLIALGPASAGFAGWVLSRRRPLFAKDRVLSARIALAVPAVTAVVGVIVTAAAVLALVRARHRRGELLRLRDALRQGAA